MATLITKNSSTASAVPLAGDLTKGELAVNVTDKKVYTKDNGGNVVKLVGSLGNQEANAVAITGGTVSSTNLTDSGNTFPSSLATLTGSQTLTNKTIEAGTFTNGYTEETVTANTSTAYTIDLANGTVQILTLTGNCTFTFPAATAGKSFMLLLKQDGTGSRTVTWPAAVKWPNATAPTITATASKLDKYVFTADGTNWYGTNAGQNYTV